jgi:hemoglobin/transferrin/lactoferrin receptor protein
MTVSSVAGTVTTLPAPNLKEETSVTAELGLRWYGDKTDLNLTAYESRYDDLIGLVNVGAGLMQKQNIAKATIRGIELDGRTALSNEWSLKYALTRLEGSNDSSNKPLPHIAPLSGKLGLKYETKGFYSEVNLRAYQGKSSIDSTQERATEDYGIVNLYAGYDLNKEWTLTMGIENLLDNVGRNPAVVEDLAYSNDLLANPLVEPGRSVMLKLSSKY